MPDQHPHDNPDQSPHDNTDEHDLFTTEEVLAVRQEMQDESAEEALNLGSFSDEEIAALMFEGEDRPVPTPWLDSLEEQERELAVAMGMRSLTVRGLVEALPLDDVSGTIRQTSPPEVWALLGMRRFAQAVVVAERKTTLGTDWIVLYGQGQDRWLAEFITAQGFHEFVLARSLDTALALLSWSGVDPEAAVPDLDLLLTIDQVQQQDPRLEPVGRSLVAVTLSHTGLAAPDRTQWYGLYSGPEGTYLSRREGAQGMVRFRGEAFAAVEEFVAALLGEG